MAIFRLPLADWLMVMPIKIIYLETSRKEFHFSDVHGGEAELEKIYLNLQPKYSSYFNSRSGKFSRCLLQAQFKLCG